MSRDTVAMCLSLAFGPAVVVTVTGFAPWALPAWITGWIVLLLTKEPRHG